MHLFRVRLILALIVAVTLVSVASTYFDVLAHKHTLRVELERRIRWMGMSMQPDVTGALETGDPSAASRSGGRVSSPAPARWAWRFMTAKGSCWPAPGLRKCCRLCPTG